MSAVRVPGGVMARDNMTLHAERGPLASVVNLEAERRRRKAPNTTTRAARGVARDGKVRGERHIQGALEDAVRRHPSSYVRTHRGVFGGTSDVVGASVLRTLSSEVRSSPIDNTVSGQVSAKRAASDRDSARESARSFVSVLRGTLVWVLATVVTISGALGLGLMLRPSEYQGQTWQHTVTAGESVWGLAASVGSQRSIEQVVEDIRVLNQMEDATLYAGQTLLLPID